MPLSEEDFWDLWSFVIIFEDVGNWWELQGCLVYKMHLASVILSLSTQTWSESHFINNLNEICSDARIWQMCARTRCDFRRKGSISKLWGQIFSIEWNNEIDKKPVMPLSEEDFWDLWSFVIIFQEVGNWWELQGCLVYKMHLASAILSLSTQTWSESHFINNLNEICSDARIWQRCARTRCDFRRKGSISKLWGQIFSIEWNRQKTSHAPFWRRFLGFVIICDHFWRCWELMGIARVFGL